jgi:large subunit ribosomal protein L31
MPATAHPRYDVSTITCTTCGATHVLRSTRGDHTVDVCAECHPFYTGEARPVASGGRVERFRQREARRRAPR